MKLIATRKLFAELCSTAIFLAIFTFPCSAESGADKSSPYYNILDFGAKGDGQQIDSPAIDQAIDAAAAAGGGTVFVPAGTYACYTIHLKSHVTLYLDAGSTILAADPAPEGMPSYDLPEPNEETDKYQDFGHSHWRNSLIYGEDLENISILGPGRIYGKGLVYGHHAQSKKKKTEKKTRKKRPMKKFQSDEEPKDTSPHPMRGSSEETPFGYPRFSDSVPDGTANKAIALKNCRNVVFRDFTIFHGGHFAILATGVDNWICDNLTIDTNRDGIDIDCCSNVRVSNCQVNSPGDDAICLKSSYALGKVVPTRNVLINNCFVSGFVEGTLIDGTREWDQIGRGSTGRIKLGTEANGGFQNITIVNCIFDSCRGLALEEVDGGKMEDITISNITMQNIVNAPIYIRLANRNRGPDLEDNTGSARRIKISNVVAYNVWPDHGILISGVPGNAIEDISLSNILIYYRGGGTEKHAQRIVPEYEYGYPEPYKMGILPAYGLFARHVKNLTVRDVEFRLMESDARPGVFLEDIEGVYIDHLSLDKKSSRTIRAKNVADFTVINSHPIQDDRNKTIR